MNSETLFDQVVRITYIYLGPAADRFVSRQITNHLGKKPRELDAKDMAGLTDWLRVAMGFLTEDQMIVQDYVERLEALQPLQTVPTNKHKKRLSTHADAQ